MDDQTILHQRQKTSRQQTGKESQLSEREQRMESFVPNQDERFLGPVTRTGYTLQKNYRSYTTTQLKQALDQGDYKVVGRTFRGSRTRKTKKKKDNHHSELMTPLVETIDRLEAEQNKRITPENVEKQIELLMSIYDRIFKLAFKYCVKQNPWFPEGKARRDMVLLIRDQANEERLKLGNNARVLADEVRNHPDQTFTFADAIREIRTQKIKAGENGIKEIQAGGKGTSDIIVAVKEDGSKLYIRPSESLKRDNVPCRVFMKDTISQTKEEIEGVEKTLRGKNLTEEEKERETQHLSNLRSDLEIQEMFERVLTRVKAGNEKNAEYAMRKLSFWRPSEFPTKINEDGVVKRFFLQDLELKHFLNEASADPVYQRYATERSTVIDKAAVERAFDQQDSRISRLLRAVKLTGKHINQRDFARSVAMVKEGSNISNRNVAVSILARALGLRDLVAESQMVEVEVNGKKIRGTVMEEAQGVDLGRLAHRNREKGRKIEYSVQALKQITSLQVFDILCGQVDRKTDNYLTRIVQKDGKDVILGFKAIDNDMSCGMIDYEADVVKHYSTRRKARGYRQQLPAISDDTGLINVEAIDKNLKDRIMAMQPTYIDFLLAGILSTEERGAMKRRLIALKILFRNEDEYAYRTGSKSIFLKTTQEWDKFKNRYETIGTSVNTYLLPVIH